MARIGWHSLRFGGLGRGTVQTTGGLLGRALLQAAYLVVISRWLGSAGYGLFAGSAAAAILLSPLAGWGMGQVYADRQARPPHGSAGLWARVASLVLRIGLVLAAVLVVVTSVAMAVRIDVADMALIALAELVALPLANVASMALVAERRSDLAAITVSAVPAARLAGALCLLAAGAAPSVHALALTHCAGSLLAAAAVAVLARRVLAAPAIGGASVSRRELLHEGAPYAATALAGQGYAEIDKVLVLQLAGAGAAGTYTAAFRVVSVLLIPITALVNNSLPRLFAAERDGAGTHLLRRVTLAAVAYGLAAGLFALAIAPLVPLVFGADFAASAHYVMLLGAWVPLVALHQSGAAALVAAGGKSTRLGIEVAGLGAVVALDLALLPRWGVAGAISALLACEALLAMACWIALLRRRRAP